MEPLPPPDMSVLQQTLSALQGEVARMSNELADLKNLFAASQRQLTGEQYTDYNDAVKHKYVLTNTEEDMPATQEIPLKQPSPNLLKPGKKPQKKYKHHCKVCDGEWIGDEPNPPSCNYCRSRIWQLGETKWALRRKSQEAGKAAVA